MLLAYILDPTDIIIKDLHNLANRETMDLNLVFADDKISLSVEEWLAQFRDADAVITNSYHGTIFSIIFRKPFYSLTNEERGTDRFVSLFNNLSISTDNYGTTFPKNVIFSNWNKTTWELASFQNNSIVFLKNALNKV